MNPPLLLVVCTHNPRPDFLAETLDALRAQTLPPERWELLLVDNASAEPLARRVDLRWHPRAAVVAEPRLGTAHARHRALREAAARGAGLLLFVDDDNVLARSYLEEGLRLAAEWPRLGAWGGQLLPRYEAPPPDWIGRYLDYLAVAPLAADRWTNCVHSYAAVPPTAGCFVRAAVWQRYLLHVTADPRRLILGARGDELVRGEDTDLVLTAVDLGLGLGRFRALRLEHLIPRARLTPAYVARLAEGIAQGIGLLEYLRYRRLPRAGGPARIDRLLAAWRAHRLPEPHRSIRLAEMRGREAARHTVLRWRWTHRDDDTPAAATFQPSPS
jgi:glycosyltransferase involved in cell wall biosynthesis